MFLVLLIATVTFAMPNTISQENRMRNPFVRNVCAPTESCLTTGFGLNFGICDCPGNVPCPENDSASTVKHKGFSYTFCEPRQLRTCQEGETATTVKNFSMHMHCLCPDGQEFIHKDITDPLSEVLEYVCGTHKMCAPDQRCQVNVRGTPQTACICPAGSSCVSLRTDSLMGASGFCV